MVNTLLNVKFVKQKMANTSLYWIYLAFLSSSSHPWWESEKEEACSIAVTLEKKRLELDSQFVNLCKELAANSKCAEAGTAWEQHLRQ